MSTSDVKRLAPDAFRRALWQGRGTAMLHVLSHGLEGVEESVLDACLEEKAYDRQCEDHRAPWLYRMFRGSAEYAFFQRRIIAELREMSEESSAEQLCELAALMARDGDAEAGAALRSFVWAQDFREASGCHAIASVDGFPALLELARRYGQLLQDDPNAFVDSLDALTDNADAREAALTELTIHAKADSAIAAYVEYEKQAMDRFLENDRDSPAEQFARREKTRHEILNGFPLEKILAWAEQHDKSKLEFIRFGRWATAEMLDVVLGRLAIEEDVETCLRLLWVFRYGVPSSIPERLWVLSMHKDRRLRDAALTALANSTDPAVGEFGRKYLAQDTFSADDAAAIELLSKHYRPGDEDLVMGVLNRLTSDDDEAHCLGMSIRAFATENNSPAIAQILRWMYRTNPCTICRDHAVELLSKAGSLCPVIALEHQYDARIVSHSLEQK